MSYKKSRKAIKRTLLMMSVAIAVLVGGAGFVSATNCVEIDKCFWISTIIFILAIQYIFLFMYANGAFIDELMLEMYKEMTGYDYRD